MFMFAFSCGHYYGNSCVEPSVIVIICVCVGGVLVSAAWETVCEAGAMFVVAHWYHLDVEYSAVDAV